MMEIMMKDGNPEKTMMLETHFKTENGHFLSTNMTNTEAVSEYIIYCQSR